MWDIRESGKERELGIVEGREVEREVEREEEREEGGGKGARGPASLGKREEGRRVESPWRRGEKGWDGGIPSPEEGRQGTGTPALCDK